MASSQGLHEGKIRCEVCPKKCWLTEGQIGRCRARKRVGEEVVCINYGAITSMALDPVEKKPLAMWHSNEKVLSVGSFGCNLECPFCQNADISQTGEGDVAVKEMTPEQLVQAALDAVPQGNIGIAYTYNEPMVGYEFVRDTAKLAHEAGLLNVLVTNGMVNEKPLMEVLPYIDAMSIDLKGFTPRFYSFCGHGDLEAVEQTIQHAVDCPTCHVEVVTLIVPESTDMNELEAGANWLSMLDPNIPYHVTQYHPAFNMRKVKPVSEDVVRQAADRAHKYLNNVFIGNL